MNRLSEPTLGGWLVYVLREADGALSMEEALHAILDSMKTYFPSQSVAVLLVDEETKEVRIKISRQISYSFVKAFRRKAPGPHLRRLILEQEPLLLAQADPAAEVYREIKLEHDFTSAVLAPIIKNHRGIGCIFCDRASPPPFNPSDLLHLQVIGFLIGSLMVKFELMAERRQLSQVDEASGALKYSTFVPAFVTELHRAASHGYPVNLALLDIDAFRYFLDTHGIDRAHALLAEITGIVRRHTNDVDLLARYSADQMVLCLSGRTPAQAAEVLQTICNDVQRSAGAGAGIPVVLKVGALSLTTDKARKTPLQDLMGALGKALMAAETGERVNVTPLDAAPA
jgi:diguanylate cyclase (GGDEF)-like protein